MTPANFKRARDSLGLTQEQMADALGYIAGRQQISRIERGEHVPHPAVWGLLVAMEQGKLPVDWLARIGE